MAPVPAGFSQVTAVFDSANLPYGAVTTIGIDNIEVGDPEEALGAVASLWSALHFELAHSQTSLIELQWKVGPSATGPTFNVAMSVAGGVGGDPGPPNTAYLIRKAQSAASGKFGGRMYYPGVSESVVNGNGTLQAANYEDFQIALDTFHEGIVENVGPLYIFSATGEVPRLVNSLEIQATVATQRRRLRR